MTILTATGSAGMGSMLITLVLMLAVFYFMLIRPENKRKKEAEQMRSSVKTGDKITTIGGMEIYGINGFVIGPLIAALFIACWNLLSGRDHAGNIDELDEDFLEEGKNHEE